VPWGVDVKNRTNPRNGLCLNALHDRAFDCGLLTVTPEMHVKVSPKAKGSKVDDSVHQFLWRFQDAVITPPNRFSPDVKFLRYHNEEIFLG
jgi:putative restriction endonuclease